MKSMSKTANGKRKEKERRGSERDREKGKKVSMGGYVARRQNKDKQCSERRSHVTQKESLN